MGRAGPMHVHFLSFGAQSCRREIFDGQNGRDVFRTSRLTERARRSRSDIAMEWRIAAASIVPLHRRVDEIMESKRMPRLDGR
jgi:hypothetical protein